MTHAVGRRPALLAALLAAGISFGCESRRPEGNAIVVAITNSPLNLDPRVGSERWRAPRDRVCDRPRRHREVPEARVRELSLWYKTNVAVFQPDLRGVHLSPIADFTFLKGVARDPGVARP